MASGNKRSAEQVTRRGDSVENRELERVKKNLEEVVRKNKDLEEMLLYTSQELEKEKENSRKIVQTLTERLMESREMINKLEVENMRYKKDCMLAVELLQCNRGVHQGNVSNAVKKLSAYTEPVVHQPYPTENPVVKNENDCTSIIKKTQIPDEKKNVQPTRPRSLSKRKSKSAARDEDTTALLAKQDANELKIVGQVESSPSLQNKALNKDTSLEHHKDLGENQLEETPEKTSFCAKPATINSNQQKQCDDPQGIAREGINLKSSVNIRHYLKEEKQCLTKGDQLEGERLIANNQSENKEGHVDEYRAEPEGANEEESCPKRECLNDEWSQEDKPLIINESQSLRQQHSDTSQERENSKAQAVNMYPKESKKTGLDPSSDFTQSTSLTSRIPAREDVNHIKETQDDTLDDEHDKLVTHDKKMSVGKQSKKIVTERTYILEDNRTQTAESEAEETASNENDKISLDNSISKEIKSNDGGISTLVPENVDDETLTGEEDTPLV